MYNDPCQFSAVARFTYQDPNTEAKWCIGRFQLPDSQLGPVHCHVIFTIEIYMICGQLVKGAWQMQVPATTSKWITNIQRPTVQVQARL